MDKLEQKILSEIHNDDLSQAETSLSKSLSPHLYQELKEFDSFLSTTLKKEKMIGLTASQLNQLHEAISVKPEGHSRAPWKLLFPLLSSVAAFGFVLLINGQDSVNMNSQIIVTQADENEIDQVLRQQGTIDFKPQYVVNAPLVDNFTRPVAEPDQSRPFSVATLRSLAFSKDPNSRGSFSKFQIINSRSKQDAQTLSPMLTLANEKISNTCETGTVLMNLFIDGIGTLQSIELGDQHQTSPFAECVAESLRAESYPVSGYPQTIEVKFLKR